MRIALRTGAGRGAIELAGSQGTYVASDLFDREMFFEITPDIVIPGRSTAALRQGKPRIKLDEATRAQTTHIYSLLAAILLLPRSKREFSTTHGDLLLRDNGYSITVIKVDVARLEPLMVLLRPTELLLENADGLKTSLDFTARMARIIRVWEVAERVDSALARLISVVAVLVRGLELNYHAIERASRAIGNLVGTDGDILLVVEQQLNISLDTEANRLDARDRQTGLDRENFGEDEDISPHEALIQRVKTWRKQADRGSSGRRFSQAVSQAYDFRCLFTGQRLPRLEDLSSPGVDSAHILPWSTHDLDGVRNGICLSKQSHWAFDEGILRLDFKTPTNSYVVSIPETIRSTARRANFDLDYYEALTGPVPVSRLPLNHSLWPSPTYLSDLNSYLGHL